MFLSLRYGYGYTDSNWYSLWMDLFDELYVLCLLVSECYCGLGASGFTIKVILRIWSYGVIHSNSQLNLNVPIRHTCMIWHA